MNGTNVPIMLVKMKPPKNQGIGNLELVVLVLRVFAAIFLRYQRPTRSATGARSRTRDNFIIIAF